MVLTFMTTPGWVEVFFPANGKQRTRHDNARVQRNSPGPDLASSHNSSHNLSHNRQSVAVLFLGIILSLHRLAYFP
jgi:hypothetical protein